MSFGIHVYRGSFALALAVRLPAMRFDKLNWLIIGVLLLVIAGLPLGLLPGLVSSMLGLAFTLGMLLAEIREGWRWKHKTGTR